VDFCIVFQRVEAASEFPNDAAARAAGDVPGNAAGRRVTVQIHCDMLLF